MNFASGCLLCDSKARLFHHTQDREWLARTVCKAIYQLHDNDVTDSGYQRCVPPIIQAVQVVFDSTAVGLDFVCG